MWDVVNPGFRPAAGVTSVHNRSPFVSASTGGFSREIRVGNRNAKVAGQDPDNDAMHIRRNRRSWKDFFRGQADRGNAACRKGSEHSNAARTQRNQPSGGGRWGSFFLRRDDRGNAKATTTQVIPKKMDRSPFSRGREVVNARRQRANGFAGGNRSAAGDAGGETAFDGHRGGGDGTASTISVATNSTISVSTSIYSSAGRRYGTSARANAVPTVPEAKLHPRGAVIASPGFAGELLDKGAVTPAPPAVDRVRPQSCRIGGSKCNQLMEPSCKRSADSKRLENRLGEKARDHGSSNGVKRAASVQTRLVVSAELKRLENHRASTRARVSSHRAPRAASAETRQASAEPKGPDSQRGRTRDRGGSNDASRLAATVANTSFRSS